MLYEGKIWVGTGAQPAFLLPEMANRHGLIAGATGTGKTVSLKVLAEGFSQMGVPVFLSDVKGDLAGMIKPGEHSDALASRLAKVGVPSFCYQSYPTIFWDVYGEQGHPIRSTVSEMGPLLLSRMLGLNETQAGVLNILFRVADDEGMLLVDLKDLKAMLAYLGENSREYTLNYGNVSAATIGAIQRAVLMLEDQGGDRFFGEPALNIADWMQVDSQGRGAINILSADKLMGNPLMYSTFLLWMLSELYELLPEQGDLAKPRMVFFFDEAHLLFNDCPKALLDKIEQVVRLIRSKGVGVYFITQNPADIPMTILSQLGNRVQHCLRAYTPLDQRGVKAAADTFRTNPAFDTATAITQLKTGEALVSFLDADGAPSMVDQATILPPQSYMSAITPDERREIIESSPFNGLYDEMVDRESAYEVLSASLQGGHQVMPAAQPVMQPVMQPAAQPVITTAPQAPQASQGFMVFDPVTGQYVNRPLETMPAAQPAVKPVVPQLEIPQPAAQPQAPQTQQMPVLMFDQATGQYVQQMVPMQYDAATGRYVPAAQQPAPAQLTKEQKAAQKEAAKAAKEAEAAARRQRSDELREERAERARRNDSVLGRIKNTAISTMSREVTRTLTRGIMGIFTGKK